MGTRLLKIATISCILLCTMIVQALPLESQGSGDSSILETSTAHTKCSSKSSLSELYVGLQVLQKYAMLKHDTALVSAFMHASLNRMHEGNSCLLLEYSLIAC